MKSLAEYRRFYFETFHELSDDELVERFNGQVRIRSWGPARQGYLCALEEALTHRGIDFSVCGNSKTMSYAHCVILKEKKLFLVRELALFELDYLFQKWVKTCRPEILKNQPYVMGIKEGDELDIAFHKPGAKMTVSIKSVMLMRN
jgi:hypothetical protein